MTRESRGQRFRAVIFDLDGVVTDTAQVHARAWKSTFDEFLRYSSSFRPNQPAFDLDHDYKQYIDGKLRVEGIISFLESRRIVIPLGEPDDKTLASVNGIGNTKNAMFRAILEGEGVSLFPDALPCMRVLRQNGTPLAIASSSKNCDFILQKTGIGDLFSAVIDGVYLQRNGLRSKPAPDIFVESARQLGCETSQVAIVEDAPSGVEAAHRSKAGLVIGIDRSGGARALLEHGADIVVSTLDDVPQSVFRSGNR